MKQIYALRSGIALLVYLFLFFNTSYAQPCTCSGGAKPDSLTYRVEFTGLTTYTSFTLPQFDPSLGTLTCLKMVDSVSSIMSFELINRVDSRFEYNMNANLTATISGPSSLTASTNYFQTFGPYDLGAAGIDPDTSVFVGPTTVFSYKKISKTINTGLAPYIGIGTVPFTFDLSGPVWPAPSSGNYAANVQTISDINVNLTYYYCPLSILANNIKNFTAVKKDNTANLSWIAQNAEKINMYTIEYSNNGRDFKVAGTVEGNKQLGGVYQFNYDIIPNTGNYIYFRIRQTDEQNKSLYSAVRTLALTDKAPITLSTYPNPVQQQVTIAFDRVMNGNFNVEIVNTAGITLLQKQVRMQNSNAIPLTLSSKPAAGIYFTRITNLSSQEQQLVKFFVQ